MTRKGRAACLPAFLSIVFGTIIWNSIGCDSNRSSSKNAKKSQNVQKLSDEDLETGRLLYQVHCWFCHGAKGMGDGPVAEILDVKPRDFSRAEYKIRSTAQGALPTDKDLFLTITRGVPGTHMPGWHTLSEKQRWQLVGFLKTFSDRFRTSGAPLTIPIDDPHNGGKKIVAQGKELFESTKCWLCHGKEGKGDGPITTALVRQWGFPYYARNLTDGASFKGGSTVEDIYRTITTGFNDTPMGSHEYLLNVEERWYVSYFVASLAENNISREKLLEEGVSWQRGRWVFFGKGHCIVCHKTEGIGSSTRGPDLSEVGKNAQTRREGLDAIEYIYESITKPYEFLVEDYAEHMPVINQDGIVLTPLEIQSLVVYLTSQGIPEKLNRNVFAKVPVPPEPDASLEELHELEGDPARGWQIFKDEKTACIKCHRLHGQGDTLAPDLSNLASIQSIRQVRESILDPNKVITWGYQQVTILTEDGKVVTGVEVEGDSAHIRLVDSERKTHNIPKDVIDEMILQKTSNMPSDISKQLNEQQQKDLVSFLLDQQPALNDIVTLPDTHRLVDLLKRPKNGPPLKNIAHKVGSKWLAEWLKNPPNHDPKTFMPTLELKDDEIAAIIAYLSMLAEPDFTKYRWEPYFNKLIDDLDDKEFEQLDKRIAEGKRLWSQSRCSICHRVGELGGVVGHAPALTKAASKLRRDWLFFWLEDPRYHYSATQMPHFRFSKIERKNLVAYLLKGDEFGGMDLESLPDNQNFSFSESSELVHRGQSLIEKNRCIVCHDIPGIRETVKERLDWPEPRNDFELLVRDARCLTCHNINGQGGTFAPELTTVGSRLKQPWVEKFLLATDVIRPLLKQMPKLNLTPQETQTFAEYAKRNLLDPRIDSNFLKDYKPTPQDIATGKKIYDVKGCVACHQIGLAGGAVGPELTNVNDRLMPGYIYAYLQDPQKFRPDVIEPNYGFSAKEALQLTKFLMSLSSKKGENK